MGEICPAVIYSAPVDGQYFAVDGQYFVVTFPIQCHLPVDIFCRKSNLLLAVSTSHCKSLHFNFGSFWSLSGAESCSSYSPIFTLRKKKHLTLEKAPKEYIEKCSMSHIQVLLTHRPTGVSVDEMQSNLKTKTEELLFSLVK